MGITGDILADFPRNSLDEVTVLWFLDFQAASYSFAYSIADACQEKSLAMPFIWMRRQTAGSLQKIERACWIAPSSAGPSYA
jgi:hypothetical protein